MFGMGWSEIILIGIVGVLVFGPDKLPEFARQSARLVRTVRRMAQDAKDDLGRELGHDLSGLRAAGPRPARSCPPSHPRRLTPQLMTPPKHRSCRTTGDRPPVDPDAT